MSRVKPTPSMKEIELDTERYFISSTDLKGVITSVNVFFVTYQDIVKKNCWKPTQYSSPSRYAKNYL